MVSAEHGLIMLKAFRKSQNTGSPPGPDSQDVM